MKGQHTKEKVAAGALIACITLVCAWLLASCIARSGTPQGTVSGESFIGFSPGIEGWWSEEKEVSSDPLEPNIIVYALRYRYPKNMVQNRGVSVRIVHGYNMCDCMRIKGYTVELLRDNRQPTSVGSRESGSHIPHLAPSVTSPASSSVFSPTTHNAQSATHHNFLNSASLPYQLWRLTSSTDDVAIWVTTMIRATDLVATSVDTRDMAFPRIGIPDAQGWAPRGFSLKGLRHPIRNTRLFLRSKWNASRCDLLTFLGLRSPAWVSQDMLTLVSVCHIPGTGAREEDVILHVLGGHAGMLMALRSWGEERGL